MNNWQEQAKTTAEFHRKMQKEKGESQTGRPRKGEKKSGWSIRDTADKLGVSVRQVVEDLKLAKEADFLAFRAANYSQILERKDALILLSGKELKVDKAKFLKDSIVSALGWLATGKKSDVKKAIEILEKAIE